jgi:hypothetical protein
MSGTLPRILSHYLTLMVLAMTESVPEEPKLPTWLSALLPSPRPATLIARDADGFIAVSTEGVTTALGDDIEAAYDTVTNSGVDVVFDASVREHLNSSESWLLSSSIGVPTHDGMKRLLMSHTDIDRLHSLEDDYKDFLELDAQWRDDPNDFLKAWNWLDRHPAFWVRSFKTLPSDDDWNDDFLWLWETSGHCQKIEVAPFNDDNGELVISLETGEHVPSEEQHVVIDGERRWVSLPSTYWNHYHDYRLDTYAATFEEAIIRLAGAVDRFFNTDGTEKPDVDHEVPRWVTELQKRVEDLPRSQTPPAIDLYVQRIAELN